MAKGKVNEDLLIHVGIFVIKLVRSDTSLGFNLQYVPQRTVYRCSIKAVGLSRSPRHRISTRANVKASAKCEESRQE